MDAIETEHRCGSVAAAPPMHQIPAGGTLHNLGALAEVAAMSPHTREQAVAHYEAALRCALPQGGDLFQSAPPPHLATSFSHYMSGYAMLLEEVGLPDKAAKVCPTRP